MNSNNKRKLTGCLLLFLIFAIISGCFFPTAIFIGGFTSTLQADFVSGIIGKMLCPEDSVAEIITYETTTLDEIGNRMASTGYEMQCVDANGVIVREPNPDYAFYWVGILATISLFLSLVLSFLLFVPISSIIGRIFQKSQNRDFQNPLS